jgi:hypothetical protein
MNLGQLIKKLEVLPQELPVRFRLVGDDVGGVKDGDEVHGIDSYRGFYERLALQPFDEEWRSEPLLTVGALLARCKAAVGQTFHGYKGGDYVMDERTSVHADRYGECHSDQIIAVEIRGESEVSLLVAHVED